jgi:glycogen synthase kinase 3 beta
MEDILEFHVEK